jgi:hypothetical protein
MPKFLVWVFSMYALIKGLHDAYEAALKLPSETVALAHFLKIAMWSLGQAFYFGLEGIMIGTVFAGAGTVATWALLMATALVLWIVDSLRVGVFKPRTEIRRQRVLQKAARRRQVFFKIFYWLLGRSATQNPTEPGTIGAVAVFILSGSAIGVVALMFTSGLVPGAPEKFEWWNLAIYTPGFGVLLICATFWKTAKELGLLIKDKLSGKPSTGTSAGTSANQ